MSGMELVLRTGAQRLRPVMLTTITTVIGLMPMVLQMNIDFIARDISIGAPSTQFWVQLSTAVVWGLTFSTVLTLMVTPCALMLRENVAEYFEGKGDEERVRATHRSLYRWLRGPSQRPSKSHEPVDQR